MPGAHEDPLAVALDAIGERRLDIAAKILIEDPEMREALLQALRPTVDFAITGCRFPGEIPQIDLAHYWDDANGKRPSIEVISIRIIDCALNQITSHVDGKTLIVSIRGLEG